MPRELHRTAICHPERVHAAKGMCYECYTRGMPRAKRASCHPGRIAQTNGLCKSCYDKWLRSVNPDYQRRQTEITKRWCEINREYLARKSREYSARPSTKKRDLVNERVSSLAAFGLTLDDEVVILDSQNGGCAICGGPSGRKGRFDIDHDHTTGKFRGLLCHRCNKGLGLLGDSLENARRAVDYLSKPPYVAAGCAIVIDAAEHGQLIDNRPRKP